MKCHALQRQKWLTEKGANSEFCATPMDSFLCFYCQEYCMFLPQQNAAMPHVQWIHSSKEQNIQVLAHPPNNSQLGCMWYLVVPPHQRKVGWVEIFPHPFQDLAKAVNSELHALSPFDYQKAFECRRRQLELCVWSGEKYFEGMWRL